MTNLHSNLVIFKLDSYSIRLVSYRDLHSNLVIFKFSYDDKIKTYRYRFTFQSGDIQMSITDESTGEVKQFTFQSGDIQIKKIKKNS